jgi:hypothetical protein
LKAHGQKLKKLRVGKAFLRDLLSLPESTSIVGCSTSTMEEVLSDSIEIVIEDDAFPEVPAGNQLMVIVPKIDRHRTPGSFVGW